MNLVTKMKGELIISCQAVDDEPLSDPFIVSRMANACVVGGAKIMRMSQIEHIKEAKKLFNNPIIGLVKKHYAGSDVVITPTYKEVEDLIKIGVDIIAVDATLRDRPKETLQQIVSKVKLEYPNQLMMADCATVEEVINADSLGFDIIGTTLRGYTASTIGRSNVENDYEFIKEILSKVKTPIIAEGGIWETKQAKDIFNLGVHAVVVGSVITRPNLIVEYWNKKIFKE